jgi:HSP20 family protein
MYLRQLEQLQQEMDQLFNALASPRRHSREPLWRTAKLFPLLNVKLGSDAYEVTAEIPGMKTDDLEIKVEGDTLTMKGERKPGNADEGVSYHRRERATGIFQRSITLPGTVDADKVAASYKLGVLTVILPVEKASAPKQISIKTE